MNKNLNIFFLLVFLVGTFLMSPGAHAFDIDNMCVGSECISSSTTTQNESNDSSSPETIQHSCGHCCHYGHAINTFEGHQTTLKVNHQNFTENYNSSPSDIPYSIKRPPRINI